jgi:regulatory protein
MAAGAHSQGHSDADTAGDRRSALAQGMRYLAAREHSEHELVSKLRAKGHAPELVRAVIDELKSLGYQSDHRYLESYLHSRIGKGYGPMVIRGELRQRGIGDELLDDAMTHTGAFWEGIAEQARSKRYGSAAPATRDDWNRQARFLARRGFPSDLIYRVLGESSD